MAVCKIDDHDHGSNAVIPKPIEHALKKMNCRSETIEKPTKSDYKGIVMVVCYGEPIKRSQFCR